nr:probable magnesium transporter NIPA6 [Ipomoea batatas]
MLLSNSFVHTFNLKGFREIATKIIIYNLCGPTICFCLNDVSFLFQALDTFNTAVVSPIYYVMFTSLTIVASVIMFKDWDGQNVGNIASAICGFVVVLSGTILLHVTKDMERSSPIRGSYTSLSPSLLAQLCSANGEPSKHEDEGSEA